MEPNASHLLLVILIRENRSFKQKVSGGLPVIQSALYRFQLIVINLYRDKTEYLLSNFIS